MKIRILSESLASAKKKYPDIVDTAKHHDPTPTFKYVEWICSRWDQEIFPSNFRNSLVKFDRIYKHLEKKDIWQYTYRELISAVNNYESKKEKKDLLRNIPKGAEKIFENDKAMVVKVNTYEASLFYGKGKFCIADTGGSLYWDSFKEDKNKFFYIIDKKDVEHPQVIQAQKGIKEFKNFDNPFTLIGWNKKNKKTDYNKILDPFNIDRNIFKKHIYYTNIREIEPWDLENLLENACSTGSLEIVKYMINNVGVNPGCRTNQPITNAAMSGHVDIVKFLLTDKRVNPTICENNPIRFAADEQHIEVVKVLLNDKRVNPSDEHNYALKSVIVNNNLEIVKLILDSPKMNFKKDFKGAVQIAGVIADRNKDYRIRDLLTKYYKKADM